ncbi:MAG: hypothetical protein IJY38_02300 [Clostridia bacterium]|nr:hypothetical protein [Clostridia bacterium]
MKDRTKLFLQNLKRPKGWLLALSCVCTLISVTAAILLVILAPKGSVWEILSYVSYGLAALFLGYTVYVIVVYAPTMKKGLVATLRKVPVFARLLDNYGYRTVVFGAASFFINIAFAAFHLALAIKHLDGWYFTLAIYYGVLISMRGVIIFYHKKRAKKLKKGENKDGLESKREEIKKFRFCGILLVTLPWTLSFEILQMIQGGMGFSYAGLTIYAVALYTFIRITVSIVQFIKVKKEDDLTLQAMRNVALADSLVSLLALQTAMFVSFANGADTSIFNAFTGAGVCAATAVIGIFMIVKAQKELKKIKGEEYAREEV